MFFLVIIFSILVLPIQTKAATDQGKILVEGLQSPGQYNNFVSLLSAKVAKDAYADNVADAKVLGNLGFKDVQIIKIKDQDMKAIVGVKPLNSYSAVIAISISGSKSVENWTTSNYRVGGEKWYDSSKCSNCYVHKGFYNYISQLIIKEDSIKFPSLNNKTLGSIIKQNTYTSGTPNSRRDYFWVTGHSLGGAAAGLYSAHLSSQAEGVSSKAGITIPKSRITTYTFGAPEFSNNNFNNYYQNKFNYYRIINQHDPVPHINVMDVVYDYLHFGNRLTLSDNAKYSNPFSYHSKDRYISLIANR